jgi:hypothetical protein
MRDRVCVSEIEERYVERERRGWKGKKKENG